MKALVILAGGLLFGWGLALCGLAKNEVVLSFLRLQDLGLAVTMLSAYLVTVPVYQLAPRLLAGPVLGGTFTRFPSAITRENLVGAAIFGAGWGLSGLCPGAALAGLGIGNVPALAGLVGMLLGSYLHGTVASLRTARIERTLQES